MRQENSWSILKPCMWGSKAMLATCGKSLFANIVALGAVNELTHCVSEEALEKAVLNRVPKGTEEANKKALQAGKNLIK